MFLDNDLITHLNTNNSVQVDSLIIAEWNQNDLSNIENYGNYRWRPSSASVDVFRNLASSYDPNDDGNFYTGALESKYISEYRVESGSPLIFLTDQEEMQLFYSLKDCFKPFRPRSGINKMLYFGDLDPEKKRFVDSIRSGRRPRYYFCSKNDQFKYWTSYRKDNGVEVGVSSVIPRGSDPSFGYEITDSAPFVVYKEQVAANRIVVKMQTNLADNVVLGVDGEPVVSSVIRRENIRTTDDLANRSKSSIPKKWKIQYLDSENNWINAISFDENSLRSDGSDIVPWDGYVEVSYGVKIPEEYRENFHFIDYISSSVQLPANTINGEAYILLENDLDPGVLWVWNTRLDEWETSNVEYGFSLLENDDTKRTGIVTSLVDPKYFLTNEIPTYRDIVFLKGLRVVVETMVSPTRTFDLIEMSPRLKADVSKYVIDFEINKDIAATDYGLPVGALVASTGQINLSNHDGAFTRLNVFNEDEKTGSIISGNLRPQTKFDFYETVLNVQGYDKFIPLKTFYSENSAESYGGFSDVSLTLRDAFFRFESELATPIFLQNCTLTMAVAVLLDNIGFGNYIFKNITTANDPVIPFFFVEPDISVAEVLQRLAQSTQTAMFFDEYNNFCMMPKEYLIPDYSISDSNSSISERLVNLYGQKEIGSVPNIEFISGVDSKIINDGQINYTTRYIQRDVPKLEQAQVNPNTKTYSYKSAILWELGDQDEQRTINQPIVKAGYSLGAVTLNTNLSASVPYVQNHQIQENIIDVGETGYLLPRFQGYLYSNGEIIRYDAQEYTVTGVGNVWITNNNEYQKYFSKLSFNGSMIVTGRLRIYTEPFYQESPGANQDGLESGVLYKNGPVSFHGRGQFGTSITNHFAGLNPYWENIENRQAFRMNSSLLFSTTPTESIKYPPLLPVSAGARVDEQARSQAVVSGKIASMLRRTVRAENNSSTIDQLDAGTVQSSALTLSGSRNSSQSSTPRDLITYLYKSFPSNDFKHVGTRMRIIGKKVDEKTIIPDNATAYFTTDVNGEASSISGGSGGLGFMVDNVTKSGYYFEIMSLSKDVISSFSTEKSKDSVLENIIFYKIPPQNVRYPYNGIDANGNESQSIVVNADGRENFAQPIKLWGTLSRVLSDTGMFIGMDRMMSQDNPTVYDLGIEFERLGSSVKFYLYLNNVLIATVIDNNPLPSVTTDTVFSTCLFVRGGSKCMFENIYALRNRAIQSENVTAISLDNSGTSSGNSLAAFGDSSISISESLRKYAISGIVQSTYLSSIGTERPPGYDMYFEEFGTIMRECAYFNIKYDQAYPAITARMIPPLNNEKIHTISGFLPGSYGAEFLLFNSSDRVISLADSSANKIVITGITFTQNISNVLTVDDYLGERSSLSDPMVIDNIIRSPQLAQKFYDSIRNSRSIYGKKSFSLNSLYVQNEDSAKDLMGWMIDKTMKNRKVITINTFGTPHIQLGDIVKIDYDLPEGVKFVEVDKRFIVTSMKYSRSSSDIKTSLSLLEV
jgi:hypothetical protein